MGEELSHWRIYLIGLGAPIAVVGLVVYGMGQAFAVSRGFETNIGLGLMIGGLIATIIGVVASLRRPDGPDGADDPQVESPVARRH